MPTQADTAGLQNPGGERSLEPRSRASEGAVSREVLEGQLRECFGRVVYSHKTHEKCADILLRRHASIKLWQILLSAVTTGGFIAAVLGAGTVAAAVGAAVSAALFALNAYTKNYDLGELAQKHRQAAADLWLIREKYLSLITDLTIGERPLGELQARRDELLEELHPIYSGAPSTTYDAYKKAQEALQRLEDLTFEDAEIDAFLPSNLRKS